MRKYRIIQKSIFLIYLAAVAYLCLGHFSRLPNVPRIIWGIPIDKWVHFIMFFPFPVLFHWAFRWPTSKWWHSLLLTAGILAVGALVAYSTEFIQGLTTYRSRDLMDFRADFKALSLSSIIVLTIELIKIRKK
ncbi:MAG: VanZ family protein [Bacteroidia bacterium]|nr:VanZ family protein [Bacteroidia bacterium]